MFKLFKSKIEQYTEERVRKLEAERDELADKVFQANEKLKEYKAQTKRAEEEIRHHQKLAEERQELANERFKVKCEAEKDEAIARVKDQYRDKTEDYLNTQISRGEDMFKEVLKRLPNVSARLKGEV